MVISVIKTKGFRDKPQHIRKDERFGLQYRLCQSIVCTVKDCNTAIGDHSKKDLIRHMVRLISEAAQVPKKKKKKAKKKK